MKALTHALYFGILGPCLGSMALTVPRSLWSVAMQLPSDPARAIAEFLAAFGAPIVMWPFAILFGGVPAAITGLIYWNLKKRVDMVALGRLRVALIMFVVGAVVAGIFGLALSGFELAGAMFALPGGAASAMLALLLHPRPAPPDTSAS